MLTPDMPAAPGTDTRRPRSRLILAATLALPALVLGLLALARPTAVAAQPGPPEAAMWRTALLNAPVTPGEALISDFFSVILVPPSWSDLFYGWAVEQSGSSNRGHRYDIAVALPYGWAELHGSQGWQVYEDALASAPPGCRTVEGRARGYCFRAAPHYEYFPSLHVNGSPAIAMYGGFETGYGAHVNLTWYDAALNVSYRLTIYGMDGPVAQAGFIGQTAAEHVGAAEALASLASHFIGL